MNTVCVKINGVDYNLKGEEREQYLYKVAEYVDNKMQALMEGNRKLSPSSAAILTALNVVDDFMKCDRAYQELCDEIELMEKEVRGIKEENDLLKGQLLQIEHLSQKLRDELEEAKDKQSTEVRESVERLNLELKATQDKAEQYLGENLKLKADNKELKFQLQSAKYKLIDVQNKLLENQISLARARQDLKST